MPTIKDRQGDKVKTNVVTNEVKEIRAWIKKRQIKEGRYIAPVMHDYKYTVLHRKGQWVNPSRISILNDKKGRMEYNEEWINREMMDAQSQQRLLVERMFQRGVDKFEVRYRTQKHADKDKQLYQSKVYRNEGGNLMSSIAGAGCNKFHEFRQIRRNDRDREKFFDYLRDKEAKENARISQLEMYRKANERRLNRNRRKRGRCSNNLAKTKKRTMAERRRKRNFLLQQKQKLKDEGMKLTEEEKEQIHKDLKEAGLLKEDGTMKDEIDIEDDDDDDTESVDSITGEAKTENKQGPSSSAVHEEESDSDDSYCSDDDEGLPPKALREKFNKK